MNLAYIFPFPYMSVFVATGFYLVDFGWNTGIKIHAIPENSKSVFRINFKLMYGVNGATVVVGDDNYNKAFIGITPGVGFEFMFGSKKANGFDMDLNFPMHGQDFKDQVDRIKHDLRVGQFSDPLPFALSFGYHHEF